MSILFVGNNAADFFAVADGITIYDVTDTNLRDADYANSCMEVVVTEGQATPFGFNVDTPSDDMWLHFRVRTPGVASSGQRNGFRVLGFYDENDQEVFRFQGNDADAWITAFGDTEEDGTTLIFSGSSTYTIDIHLERDGTTDITATLYVNGAQVSTATAANTTAGAVAIERVLFENYNVGQTNAIDGQTEMQYSEIICTDGESTIGWRVAVLEADTDGFHTDFDGGAAEVGDNDLATSAGAASNGDTATFNPTTYNGPSTTSGVRAVCTKTVAAKGDTGPGTLKQLLRLDSTDYEGSSETLEVNSLSFLEVWDDNPDTLAPWDTDDFASLEFGVKAET